MQGMTRALIGLMLWSAVASAQTTEVKPLRLAIAGLVHGHVSGFLNAAKLRKDIDIVGLFDPDAGADGELCEEQRLRAGDAVSESGDDAGHA